MVLEHHIWQNFGSLWTLNESVCSNHQLKNLAFARQISHLYIKFLPFLKFHSITRRVFIGNQFLSGGKDGSWMMIQLHSLQQIAKATENRPFAPRGRGIVSLCHHFSRAYVSCRELTVSVLFFSDSTTCAINSHPSHEQDRHRNHFVNTHTGLFKTHSHVGVFFPLELVASTWTWYFDLNLLLRLELDASTWTWCFDFGIWVYNKKHWCFTPTDV